MTLNKKMIILLIKQNDRCDTKPHSIHFPISLKIKRNRKEKELKSNKYKCHVSFFDLKNKTNNSTRVYLTGVAIYNSTALNFKKSKKRNISLKKLMDFTIGYISRSKFNLVMVPIHLFHIRKVLHR